MSKLKPTLYIVCGQVGSGKTTTAKKLSSIIKVPIVSVDETLKKLFTKPSFIDKDKPPTTDELKICYNTFALITEYFLRINQSIIIDGAFAQKSQRDLLLSIAKKYHADFKIMYITCPDMILRKRVEKRFKQKKGVGYKAHVKIKKSYEPLTIAHHVIDTSKNVQKQLKLVLGINK